MNKGTIGIAFNPRKGYIYKIVSPTGRIYIGKTYNINTRLGRYRTCGRLNQPNLFRSLKKYGYENHTIEILLELRCTDSLLNYLESFYINTYNSYKKGMNMTKGGDGSAGRVVSEKTKGILRHKRKSYFITDETRMLMSINRKGKKKPIGFGDKVSKRMKGIKFSDSWRCNLSNKKKGCIAHNRKMVLNTQTGIYYDSIREASLTTNMHNSKLRGQLNGYVKNKGIFIYV